VTWVRLDDRAHDNRKWKRLWLTNRGALALHALALSYCGAHETDGHVDAEMVTLLAPGKADRNKLTTSLVDAGVWHPDGDGWRINDFLEYNPSRADLDEKRRKDSERKARGRRTQSEQTPPGHRDDSAGPVPTRPDPTETTTPTGSTSRAQRARSVEPKLKLADMRTPA
jgi:hypothetical protein